MGPPLGYFVTFHCYGSWLPGDARGSMDRRNAGFGTPAEGPRPWLERAMARMRRGPPIVLDAPRRSAVDFAIRDHCAHRAWRLHALHVRTNHVHLVVSAAVPPEQVMSQLKAWATRRMVEVKVLAKGVRPWSRHGSTRYLWTSASIHTACRYVLEAQGSPLPT